MNIAASFIKAKKAFGPALKDKTNPAFRSKYADLGACLEAVDSAFLDAGIVLYQETFEDMTGVTVETVLLHESGESIRSGKLHVPASKQDPQGYGSALTYARRYSLMACCGIAPEDDDGNAASKAPNSVSKPVSKVGMTPTGLADLMAKMDEADTIEKLKDEYANAYRLAKVAGDSESMGKFEAHYKQLKDLLAPNAGINRAAKGRPVDGVRELSQDTD